MGKNNKPRADPGSSATLPRITAPDPTLNGALVDTIPQRNDGASVAGNGEPSNIQAPRAGRNQPLPAIEGRNKGNTEGNRSLSRGRPLTRQPGRESRIRPSLDGSGTGRNHAEGQEYRQPSWRPSVSRRATSRGTQAVGKVGDGPRSHGPLKPQQPTNSWVNVARVVEKGYNLSYIPPSFVDGKPVVEISEAIAAESDPMWLECLVGYYMGRKLPFKLTESAVRKAWGTQVTEIRMHDNGFFFFRIPDGEFRRKILEAGPLSIMQRTLVMQQWHAKLKLQKEQFESLPIWVKMRSIPLALWSASGISAIASTIGKPLYVDVLTEHKRRISYARVCVEIKATQQLSDSVDVLWDGERTSVAIEYEWKPWVCGTCKVYGHKVGAKDHPCAAPTGRAPPNPAAPPPQEFTEANTIIGQDSWQPVTTRKSRSKAKTQGMPREQEISQGLMLDIGAQEIPASNMGNARDPAKEGHTQQPSPSALDTSIYGTTPTIDAGQKTTHPDQGVVPTSPIRSEYWSSSESEPVEGDLASEVGSEAVSDHSSPSPPITRSRMASVGPSQTATRAGDTQMTTAGTSEPCPASSQLDTKPRRKRGKPRRR